MHHQANGNSMPIVRTVVRSLIACVLAVAVAGIAGLALATPVALAGPAASIQGEHQQSAEATGAVASGLAVSIDSVSPRFATANSTITVRGTITNHTGGPLEGVQVQLQTSSTKFTSRSEMGEFSSSGSFPSPLDAVIGTGWPQPATSTLHSGGTMSWTASFPAASQGYMPYEVYPIEAQALSASFTPLGDARTFLPYWPGSGTTAPDRLDISWIWPLIDAPQQDTPQQGTCAQDLATNELASSLAAGGRLNGLLAAGLEYAGPASLTWAVDPALLSDATVMTHRYKVGGNSKCTETIGMPASSAAGTWLNELQKGTQGEPMFVTPYADPDVSALVHSGLDGDLKESYSLGNSEAQQVLARPFGPDAPDTSIAWPANGTADAGVLTSLAHDGQVATTVLNSSEMPALPTPASAYPPDDAVTSVPNGIGSTMNVLLADSEISTELGSATADSSASSQFSVEQDFLAQTAMIVAEAPSTPRSVVIAPPRRWDPSEGEAAALLSLTSTRVPWLRPVPLASLPSLGGKKADAVPRKQLPASKVDPRQLSSNYMSNVESAGRSASLYSLMLYKPATETTTSLSAAVAATESSAWRGRASPGGWSAINTLSDYLSYREEQVRIITGNTVVLAGPSGTTPVSVSNGLDVAVRVRVRALLPPNSPVSVPTFNSLVIIPPQQIQIVRMPVRSATLGSTLIQLQLVTRNGTPLGTPQSLSTLSIESTRFGRALLIVIAAALGVLVLSSLARWVRRKWREGISEADGTSGGTG
ncbi:MAG: hypothetical protein JWM19_4658 [Actinomycetia bacterium]|nr:hypothetical protein [Actinomycetes bacterium]